MNTMQKGFANIVYLLAGLIALVLVGGAFYAGKISNQSQSQTPFLTKETSVPQSTDKVLPTPITTSQEVKEDKFVEIKTGWKTYTNNTYKFSLQYPASAEVQEVSPVYLLIHNRAISNFYPITIFLSKNPEGLSRREFYAKQGNSKINDILPYINIKETFVGNTSALRIVQDAEYYKQQSTAYTNYVIRAGENIIEIVTNEYVGKNNGKSTDVVESKETSSFYQDILSTFKLF